MFFSCSLAGAFAFLKATDDEDKITAMNEEKQESGTVEIGSNREWKPDVCNACAFNCGSRGKCTIDLSIFKGFADGCPLPANLKDMFKAMIIVK